MTDHAFSPAERSAIYRVIAERRDMRRFVPGSSISEEVLARLLQAAHAAPSVGLMQPWRFIRITEAALRRDIHAVVDEERLRTAEALGQRSDEFLALKVEGILDCAELFVVALGDGRDAHVFGRRTLPQMDLASVSCAIQNLWLAARAEGLGMGWVSIFDPRRLGAAARHPRRRRTGRDPVPRPGSRLPRPARTRDRQVGGRAAAERVRVREQLGHARADRRLVDVTVDLNADLGESFGVWKLGDDDAMLDVVTSANVACGFHAGDPKLLLRTCRAAAERGVRIGAQVSYRDLAGFGRRFIDADPEDIKADVIYQIGALQAIAQVCGSTVSYVKPHGALYNTIVTNHDQARAVAEAVHAVDPALPVLGLSGSVFFAEAQDLGLRAVPEAFADRAYRSDGQLVSRRLPNCCAA